VKAVLATFCEFGWSRDLENRMRWHLHAVSFKPPEVIDTRNENQILATIQTKSTAEEEC
jgi:hypothetical protein